MEPPTQLEQKVIDQIEYYFGDVNLNRDKFLREEIKKDNGWVTLQTLLTFNRLKALTSDPAAILLALKKSGTNILEISEDETKLRRNPEVPLPDATNYSSEVKERTVYIKGFPQESTLDELMDFVGKHGKLQHLAMRYYSPPKRGSEQQKKTFKGSIFATFATKLEAEQFVALVSLKYGDNELLRETQLGYFNRKNEERKRAKEEKKQRNAPKGKGTVPQKGKTDSSGGAAFTPGLLLKLSGLHDTNAKAIKEAFSQHGKVAFVEYTHGENSGYVRFAEDGSNKDVAKGILEKFKEANDGKLVLKADSEFSAEVVEGADEEAYWKKVHQLWNQREHRDRDNRRGGRGRGRGPAGAGGHQHGGRRANGEKGVAKRTVFNDDEEKPADELEDAGEGVNGVNKRNADEAEGPPAKIVKTE